MKIRACCAMALSVAVVIGCLIVPTSAENIPMAEDNVVIFGVARASDAFQFTITAKQIARANKSFHMAAGETVHFDIGYAPSGSVDIGLIDPDGNYLYFNTTSGRLDKTMQVSKRGSYTLQIRNNTAKEIKVSGYVNY